MKNKCTLFLLLLVTTIFAQDKKGSYAFSLQEAVNHALQHNYSVINVNRDIEAAKKKKWETTTMGLPQINGGIGYQNNIEIQKSLIPAEIFGGTPGTFQEVAFGVKHNMNASVTLSQLIFDGSYLVGLQSAKTYLKISENAKVKTNQEITELVINSYGNVLLADESIVILEKNKQNLEKTLFQTNEIFKNGLIEEENVEQLQITLTSLNNSLKNVKRQRTIALDMLKLLLGIDLEDTLQLTEKLEVVSQNNVDLQILSTLFDVNNSIDYQIGKNIEQSKELLLKLEKSKALPSIGAALNVGYNGFGNQFNFLSSDQKWFNYSNLGVSMSIPIFSSLRRSSRTQQAQIALEQSRTELTQTQQKLHLQFEKAKSDYEFSLEQLTNAKSNLKLAERIENKNEIKFKEGLASSFELTEAQRQLYATQQNYLQAMLDVINKRATLEKLVSKN